MGGDPKSCQNWNSGQVSQGRQVLIQVIPVVAHFPSNSIDGYRIDKAFRFLDQGLLAFDACGQADQGYKGNITPFQVRCYHIRMFIWQIWNDQPFDGGRSQFFYESLYPILEDWIDIGHDDQGNLGLLFLEFFYNSG